MKIEITKENVLRGMKPCDYCGRRSSCMEPIQCESSCYRFFSGIRCIDLEQPVGDLLVSRNED